jgi:hypothetical protein
MIMKVYIVTEAKGGGRTEIAGVFEDRADSLRMAGQSLNMRSVEAEVTPSSRSGGEMPVTRTQPG